MKGPIKPVHELYQEIENIQNELQDWKKAYEDLEFRIYAEMELAVNQKENETQVCRKQTKSLKIILHNWKIQWELVHTRENLFQL